MTQPVYNQSPAEEAQQQRDQQLREEEKARSREQASEAVEATGEQVRQSGEQAGKQALDALNERKDRLARSIDDFGEALDSAVEHLRRQQHGQLADYAQRLSGGIHDASRAVRERSSRQLWQDTSEFARRRPEVAVGAMFAAGLALSRFFKATEEQTNK